MNRGVKEGIFMFWRKKEEPVANCLTWFSYAVMLPEMDESEATVIGNMIIKNTGTMPLTNPMICIRITPPENVRLGGKIGALTHTALTIDGTNTESWHYFHDNWKEQAAEKGEHWLKPNHIHILEPGQQISFEKELRISTAKKEKYVLVEGFFYSEEIKNGMRTLNNISINF